MILSKKIVLLFCFSLFVNFGFGQLSRSGTPFSLVNDIEIEYQLTQAQSLNWDEMSLEEMDDYKLFHAGKIIPLIKQLNHNSGWQYLPTFDSYVWKQEIASNSAQGINVYFEDFNLSENAEMFIYTKNYEYILGAFTAQNNKEGYFSTAYLPGESVIIEVICPREEVNFNSFRINEIGHFFRGIPEAENNKAARNFGSSGGCNVNVNCSEGNDWRSVQRSVLRILVRSFNNQYWCTGTLINSIRDSCRNLVLLAEHCAVDARPIDYKQWVFFFNYESPVCGNPSTEGILNQQSLQGCNLLAFSGTSGTDDSDLMLVELSDAIPQNYFPYYAGWDRSGSAATAGVSIHHPGGDIKKISTFDRTIRSSSFGGSTPNTHWMVSWTQTLNGWGIVEPGSSGSALFSSEKLVIGTLTGGNSACDLTNGTDFYGRFDYHWQSNGSDSTRRLDIWLDPQNRGWLRLEGNSVCGSPVQAIPRIRSENGVLVYPNPSSDWLSVVWENDSLISAAVRVFNMKGQLVFMKEKYLRGERLNVGAITRGIYLIEVNLNGQIAQIKHIVE